MLLFVLTWKGYEPYEAQLLMPMSPRIELPMFINENIIDTLYKNYLFVPSVTKAQDVESGDVKDYGNKNKVSYVLLAIRMALEKHVVESPARELCILTTLARSDPPALEEALERVKVLREMELSDSDDPRKHTILLLRKL
nr:elongator complex protein 1 [Ipomoea batatas]